MKLFFFSRQKIDSKKPYTVEKGQKQTYLFLRIAFVVAKLITRNESLSANRKCRKQKKVFRVNKLSSNAGKYPGKMRLPL